MPASPYQPIDSAHGQIRVLILHPAAKHDAEIRCELEPVYLSRNPSYEALSYTWGSIGRAGEILLGHGRFPVRENAEAALRRLRLPATDRRLWVDAICINQDDIAERGQQVLLMQKIYSQAEQVCVWLGELTDGGVVGMKQLSNNLLAVGWHQFWVDRKYGKPMLSSTESIGSWGAVGSRSSLVQEQMIGEVREILDRPWWRRTWIVQEAVLARKLVVCVGNETATWESFQKAYGRQFPTEAFGVPLLERDDLNDDIYRTISDYRRKWHEATSSGRPSLNLFDVLLRSRRLECTNARDHVFGLLGIVPSSIAMRIVPDYNSTTADVYRRFARNVVLATGSLDILNCKREWRNVEATAPPAQVYSVIDQSRYYDVHALVSDGSDKKPWRGWARLSDGWERIPHGKVSYFKDHNSGEIKETSPLEGHPPVRPHYHAMQRILSPGWSKKWNNLGQVMVAYGAEETETEAEMRFAKEDLRRELDTLPSWVPNWAEPTAWDPTPLIDWTQPDKPQFWASGNTAPRLHSASESHILSLAGVLFDEIEYLAPAWHPDKNMPPISRRGIEVLECWEALGAVEVNNCPYRSTAATADSRNPRNNALWRTMIADHTGAGAAPDEDWVFVEAWYDRVDWSSPLPQDPSSMGPFELATLQSRVVPQLESGLADHLRDLRPAPSLRAALARFGDLFADSRGYAAYLRRIHRACAHRRLLVTAKGYVGLAPWNAREGDPVAVLCGGRTPFLLRRSPGAVAAGSHFALVGEAYVYGLMAGEALNTAGDAAAQTRAQVLHIG